MPYIRVTVTDPDLPAETRHTLAEGLTDLAVSALGKDRSRTIVQIDAVEPSTYYVDGRPLTGGARDAHVEVSITLGSNSAAEKATFIAQANELLTDTLGTLARAGCRAARTAAGELRLPRGDPVRLLPRCLGRTLTCARSPKSDERLRERAGVSRAGEGCPCRADAAAQSVDVRPVEVAEHR